MPTIEYWLDMKYLIFASTLILFLAVASAFSPGGEVPFSLSYYQKARAQETSNFLDASRFHFQILCVDDDNFHGRIAEGILARQAEYNDALFTLFPSSATIEGSAEAPRDSAPSPIALEICNDLGLCPTRSSELGTAFDISYISEYDLIIAMNESVQSLILRSLPSDSGYEPKCRTLSEFLSTDFCGIQSQGDVTEALLKDMFEVDLWQRVEPFYDLVKDSSSTIFSQSLDANDIHQPSFVLSETGSAVPNTNGWPQVQAAMLVACTGIVKFCLDTMDAQFDASLDNLLQKNFYKPQHLDFTVEQADDQLRKSSFSITGYFSPKQRQERIKRHFDSLREKFE